MKIEYKHKGLILAFSILASAISTGGVLFQSIVQQQYVAGTPTTFFVLGGMVLLIIGQFSHFENNHTQSIFAFAAYITYLVIYGGYFAKTSWGVLENEGNQVLRSINSIFGVFCAISFALLIVSLVLYFSKRNPKDSIHLLHVSVLLLLIFSSLFCLGDIIASTISVNGNSVSVSLTEAAFSSSLYLVVSIIVFLMTFYMDKSSYIRSEENINYRRSSSGNMSEKEKLDTLKRYRELLEEGIITQKEFDSKKKELI